MISLILRCMRKRQDYHAAFRINVIAVFPEHLLHKLHIITQCAFRSENSYHHVVDCAAVYLCRAVCAIEHLY